MKGDEGGSTRTGSPDGAWDRTRQPTCFTHIPKTSGTAVAAALVAALGPQQAAFGFDRAATGAFEDFGSVDRAVLRNVYLSPEDLPRDADFVTGHITPSTTRVRYPTAPHMTLLREPRVRLLSHWLFSRGHTDLMLRPLAGWGDYVRLARLPLREYLLNPQAAFCTDNLIARCLVWPSCLVEAADLPESLSTWLGLKLVVARIGESQAFRRGLACDVRQEAQTATVELAERSRIDARLWTEVAAGSLPATLDLSGYADEVLDETLERYARLPVAGIRDELLHTGLSIASGVRRRVLDLVR